MAQSKPEMWTLWIQNIGRGTYTDFIFYQRIATASGHMNMIIGKPVWVDNCDGTDGGVLVVKVMVMYWMSEMTEIT